MFIGIIQVSILLLVTILFIQHAVITCLVDTEPHMIFLPEIQISRKKEMTVCNLENLVFINLK